MSDPVVDALRLGKAMEREAIVAWLRRYEQSGRNHMNIAYDIEQGKHLGGNNG